MRRFVAEDDIRNAIFSPPETTRAYFRGRSVAKFNNEVSSIHWDEVVFQHAGGSRRVSLNQAFNDKKLDRLNDLIRQSKSFPDFMRELAALEKVD